MSQQMNIVALVKENERFIFLFDDESYPALFRRLGAFAVNPDLNFSWKDAAIVSAKARDLKKEKEK